MKYEINYHGRKFVKRLKNVGRSSKAIIIPHDYYIDKIKDLTNDEVQLYFFNGKIIITPHYYKQFRDKRKVKKEYTKFEDIQSDITAFYIGGIDECLFENIKLEWRKDLEDFSRTFYGITIETIDVNKIKVKYTTQPNDIEDEVERSYQICKFLIDMNCKGFIGESIIDFKELLDSYEREVDKIAFAAKRQIIRQSLYPEEASIDIQALRNLFDYYSIILSFERIADLAQGIYRHINYIYQEVKNNKIFTSGGYSFKQYHDDAINFLENAYNSLDDKSLAHKIILTKFQEEVESGIRERNPWIKRKNREKLIQYINSKKMDDIVKWRLNLLEESIWRITSLSVKIAQAGRNINIPEMSNI